MPACKLIESVVKNVENPMSGQVYYRDTELRGFGLRVGPKIKSYYAEKRVNGRTARVTVGAHGHVKCEEARRRAQQLLGVMAGGVDPNRERRRREVREVTLRQAFDAFVETRRSLKPGTVYTYGRCVAVAFFDWQDRPLVDITRSMVADWHRELGERRGGAYANLCMRVLRSVITFARARYDDEDGERLILENPVARISESRAWYKVPRRQTVIRPHQLPAWYAAVAGLRSESPGERADVVRDYLLLLLFTGLRRQEGARLRWDDVDLQDCTLTIRETKNDDPLTLPLSGFLRDLLARRREEATSEWVFPGGGAAGHLVEPRKQMARVTATSGVEFTLHDLRRTFITVAESLDISAYALKRLVNHRVGGDVTAGYVVPSVDRLRDPMQRITTELLRHCAQ